MKLFQRTFAYTLILMLVVVASSHLLIYLCMPQAYLMQQEQLLAEDTSLLKEQILSSDQQERIALVAELAAKWHANISVDYAGFRYQADLLDPNNSLQDSVDGSSNVTVVTTSTEEGMEVSLENAALSDADFLTLYEDLPSGNGSISITASREHIEDASRAILSILPFTALLCTLVSVVFAALFSRSLTSPIKQMEDAAEKMRKLEPDALSPVRRSDELGALSDDMNELYQTLQSTIAGLEREIEKGEDSSRQRADFLRAASHELKTPITALNAMLENMVLGIGKYRDTEAYLLKCKAMTDRLAMMVREMLDASKVLPVDDAEYVRFPISDPLSKVLEPYSIIARAKGIRVETDFGEPFQICFPPGAFEAVVSNIISNTVSYTEPGGSILIACENRKLIVRNECEPIAPDQLSRIFEPFYRPDYSRSHAEGGNGLGLYIVSTTLRALSVPFDFSPTEEADGMVFTISFSD